MKRLTGLFVVLSLTIWMGLSPSISHSQEKPTTWEVYFSPKGGCTDAIIKQVGKAKTSILVQAYTFTSAPIAKALLDAHKKGVKVEVILDKSQRTDKYSSATFLYNSGIPTKIDVQHAIAHNKIITDGETVITKSFNFTNAAEENNAEHLLVIHVGAFGSHLHMSLFYWLARVSGLHFLQVRESIFGCKSDQG